jgi:hypothetical protein
VGNRNHMNVVCRTVDLHEFEVFIREQVHILRQETCLVHWQRYSAIASCCNHAGGSWAPHRRLCHHVVKRPDTHPQPHGHQPHTQKPGARSCLVLYYTVLHHVRTCSCNFCDDILSSLECANACVLLMCKCLHYDHNLFFVSCCSMHRHVHMPAAQVHDMIAGGDNRDRWTHDDGRKALQAIHAQRIINEIVNQHRNRLQSSTDTDSCLTDALRSVDAAVQAAEGPVHLAAGEARALAQLAAAEVARNGYTRRQFKTRRRQFRKVWVLKQC